MMKTLTLLILGILICSLLFGSAIMNNQKEKETQYQGPVPQGYDEHHFRETGETKPKEIKK